MVKQERALLTRERLVRAAADAFARDGYTGSSLQDICRRAGISMGALTFHFAKKVHLARAVKEAGIAVTRHEVDRIRHAAPDPLAAVVAVTCGLVDLLARDTRVRAAQSLTNTPPVWDEAWVPEVRRLLGEAERRDLLTPTVHAETLVLLSTHLVHGAATAPRTGGRPAANLSGEFALLWDAVLEGVTARSHSY
ncbi:TetR/AcrR family transcriptional regulator [Streptomyces sp. WAC05374]|uniref:TetR/AcrR family transcriptional regulator n=1 Tax=Streptomyces sp. WAC05374 TaxID=2487420 RepID=UPI000F86573A|nr:TetR/AcrR family transcriptional regulator [Streptomyces sp. WAC05374]RST11903.1 TetR/AcrR family transcriptional regulator [Streptomyces sp. WAC05374]TDF47112.1 TetR/AcrR family transcriptional regulator [Streptomyces sp. WAC05374]TDF57370.1 TetR/AcrR family transcriptional regulator [Streptomyces sp. WAC05374]TDF61475.1 TetR/AcrR family transcriptional regulator [Streptomyces sp. WAC05374]